MLILFMFDSICRKFLPNIDLAADKNFTYSKTCVWSSGSYKGLSTLSCLYATHFNRPTKQKHSCKKLLAH